MTENDLMVQRLTELREFLAVAPDDEGDFAVWNEAIGEALDTMTSRSASIVALKAKVRQLDEYVTEEYGEWADAANNGALWKARAGAAEKTLDGLVCTCVTAHEPGCPMDELAALRPTGDKT